MNYQQVIDWLLAGDVSVAYQTHRDLLNDDRPELRKKILSTGWGFRLMNARHADGHWGRSFYQPKWTSTHYTLLELRYLEPVPGNPAIDESIALALKNEKGPDGGINPSRSIGQSDVCVNGMVLNYASYFGADKKELRSVVDFILSQRMEDGGFNCRSNRGGATHSSLHTTLSVLEGIHAYERNNYSYRIEELREARKMSVEFILLHHLFRSHRTGNIIRSEFLKFYYPTRWYYDVLKAMDYFRLSRTRFDQRMTDTIELIVAKKTGDNRWKQSAAHPGEVHFVMEKPGQPGRWNTLRALRVLKHYKIPVPGLDFQVL